MHVEHQRDRQVGHRVGEHVGGVGDDDPAPGRLGDVDVVVADPEVGDRPQVGQRVHLGGPDRACHRRPRRPRAPRSAAPTSASDGASYSRTRASSRKGIRGPTRTTRDWVIPPSSPGAVGAASIAPWASRMRPLRTPGSARGPADRLRHDPRRHRVRRRARARRRARRALAAHARRGRVLRRLARADDRGDQRRRDRRRGRQPRRVGDVAGHLLPAVRRVGAAAAPARHRLGAHRLAGVVVRQRRQPRHRRRGLRRRRHHRRRADPAGADAARAAGRAGRARPADRSRRGRRRGAPAAHHQPAHRRGRCSASCWR